MSPEHIQDYIQNTGHPYLYHGTNADAAERILQEGLRPHDWETDDFYECPNCAEGFAATSANQQQRGLDWRTQDICPHCEQPLDQSDLAQGSRSKWANQFFRPRANHVYMGDRGTVESSYMGTPNHRLLRIDLRQLDPSRIHADEDAFYMPRHYDDHPAVNRVYEDNPPPDPNLFYEHGMSLGDWADETNLGHDPEEVRHSLDYQGSIAYEGDVPPHAISLAPNPAPYYD